MLLLKIALNNCKINRIMSFYAVANGRKLGIYDSWKNCEEQIKGYKGAKYKKFPTRSAAEEFIIGHNPGYKSQYKPEEIAKPLGRNINVIKPIEDKKEIQEFWPPSDGDSFNENEISDEDLLMALAEVEGLPETSQSRKRKAESSSLIESTSNKIPKHKSQIWEPAGLKHIGPFEFLIDDEGFVIVYTDGSCFNNGQKNACAGYGVYFGDDHGLNVGKPVTGRVTNNVGEIQAAIYAIKTAKRLGIQKLCLNTDSQFLINSITMWIKGWKAKNWRLKNGEPVKNVIDFKELDSILQDDTIAIKWNYVKAHKGIKGNEMADKLAREGSELYRSMQNK